MKLTAVLQQRLEQIREERRASESGAPPAAYVPTGLSALDRTGGLKRKQISLYAGDTGSGKSLLKWHFARAAAERGFTVSVLDLEDPAERSADRLFATATNINSAKLLAGDLTDQEVRRLALAADEMAEWTERVEYHEGVRTGQEALALFEEHPADLELFDYLSALPHGKNGREREISEFMWGWTQHCQRHNVAGVAFAQLHTRRVDKALEDFAWLRKKDPDARPNLDAFRAFDISELMWCTDAGRNAKDVGYMFRPGRVLRRLGFNEKDDVMEIDFPKRSWSQEGRVRLGIDLKTARFHDLEKEK